MRNDAIKVGSLISVEMVRFRWQSQGGLVGDKVDLLETRWTCFHNMQQDLCGTQHGLTLGAVSNILRGPLD